MLVKGLFVHAGLFVVASVMALRAWTSEDQVETREKHVAAELWGGKPEQVERISFDSKKVKLDMEARKDERGRYFVGTLTKELPPPRANPHQPAKQEELEPKITSERFVSAKQALELLDELAPLHALRALGAISDERNEEFGFSGDEQATLKVTIAGKEHSLVYGGKTPGSRDRYVKQPETGEAYVISGSVANRIEQAESRLIEKNLHAWDDEEVESVHVSLGDQTRDLVRNKEKRKFWSNPSSPDQKDETASNWMDKLLRLRITKYEENPEPPVQPQDLVVRVDFFGDAKKPLGFVELVRRTGGDQTEYMVRSEQSRWYGNVLRTTAEQIDQDVKSLLGQ